MRHHRPALATLASIATLSCSDGTGPEASACTDDTGIVAVTVTEGDAPRFDWDPPCAVALVLVEEDATDQWSLATPEDTWDSPEVANVIAPPLTYGVTPPIGGLEVDDPEPLVGGVTYQLVLWRALPSGSAAVCEMRQEDFCLLAVEDFVQ